MENIKITLKRKKKMLRRKQKKNKKLSRQRENQMKNLSEKTKILIDQIVFLQRRRNHYPERIVLQINLQR